MIRGAVARVVRASCAAALRHGWLRRSAVRMMAPFPGLRVRVLRLAFAPAVIQTAGAPVNVISTRADLQAEAHLGRSGRQLYRQLRLMVDTHAG